MAARADFTSALYLGAQPSGGSFGPPKLPPTTGHPAALREPALARAVAAEVARRQGLAAGAPAPSSLHVFWDLPALLPARPALLVERGLYPVGQWGAERAAQRGVPVHRFAGPDAGQLTRLLLACAEQGRTPWLLADGWSAQAGPAPVARYLRQLAAFPGATLLLDDTQAFGVLGADPDARLPLGYGGGGSLAHAGLRRPAGVLTVTSLAKGLGVPVAVLAGPASVLARYRCRSEVRVHASPVSNVHATLAARALCRDAVLGDGLRRRLYANLSWLRAALATAGAAPQGGLFPVQRLALPTTAQALGLHRALHAGGVAALLLAGARPAVPDVALCVRADHRPVQLRQAARAVAAYLRPGAAADLVFPSSLSSTLCHEFCNADR